MIPNRKDTAMPRVIALPSLNQDGCGESQLVYFSTNRGTSSSSSVTGKVNEVSDRDHLQQGSKDIFPVEETKRNTSPYCNVSFGSIVSKGVISQNEEKRFKTTDQESSHERTRDGASQAINSLIEEKSSLISTTNRVFFESMSSKDIATQTDETWCLKSTDRVNKPTVEIIEPPIEGSQISCRSSNCIVPFGSSAIKGIASQNVANHLTKSAVLVNDSKEVKDASRQTPQTPMQGKTTSRPINYDSDPGRSMAKKTLCQKDETLYPNPVNGVQNETLSRSFSSLVTENTDMLLVSKVGSEPTQAISQLPEKLHGPHLTRKVPTPYKHPKPDNSRDFPRTRQEGFNTEQMMPGSPSDQPSSQKRLLTVGDPVRPATNIGQFSIQRSLGNQKPSQESQETNVTHSLPSPRVCERNKERSSFLTISSSCTPSYNNPKADTIRGVSLRRHDPYSVDRHTAGVFSGSLSTQGGFLTRSNHVKLTSTSDPTSTQNSLICTKPSQDSGLKKITYGPPSLNKQSSSILNACSTDTPSRDHRASKHNSHSASITTLNGNSLDGKDSFGIQDSSVKDTPSSLSQGFYRASKPLQEAVSSNALSAKNICKHISNGQTPDRANQSNPQSHLRGSVLRPPPVKTQQKRKPQVATVKAMKTFSNPIAVCSSLSSPHQSNRSTDLSGPPRKKCNWTDGKRNPLHWQRDPSMQRKNCELNVEGIHFVESTYSQFNSPTISEETGLQNFVSCLTEPESPGRVNVTKAHAAETFFDLGQQSVYERPKCYDILPMQITKVVPSQSRRLHSIHSAEGWVYENSEMIGQYNNPERDILQRYEDNMLPSHFYLSSCHSTDRQYVANTLIPRNRVHHCPSGQLKQQFPVLNRKRRLPF